MCIEEEIAILLKEKHVKITTVESCTGGLVAATLINVPGISENFCEGHITYSNEAKERILGVRHETLEKYGAVSRQTAEEMAIGGADVAGSDMCLATTGIAGPDGGTEEKPVGLVYTACYYKGNVSVIRNEFSGNRSDVRAQSVQRVLEMAKEALGKDK